MRGVAVVVAAVAVLAVVASGLPIQTALGGDSTCLFCTALVDDIGLIAKYSGSAGVMGGCFLACRAIYTNHTEAVHHCEDVCGILGVKAITWLADQVDPDPVYSCEFVSGVLLLICFDDPRS